jgi:hypothetical protein
LLCGFAVLVSVWALSVIISAHVDQRYQYPFAEAVY